jgi:isopentenyl-diphosphate Delta-isomerase
MLKDKEDLAGKDIILVDKNDNVLGYGKKMDVHRKGQLHRCFSIVILNSKNEMLLQKRAAGKYHCPNLWSNACCGHPYPNEDTEVGAHRRLKQEMGFDCPLEKIDVFHYRAEFDNGLIENEIDHLFKGKYEGEINFNQEEVGDIKWISIEELKKDIEENPSKYTPWFKIIMRRYKKELTIKIK